MRALPAISRGRLLALAAALLLVPGLWLRFHQLEWMEFGGDEVMTLVQPYRAAHERFALHGILTSAAISPPNFLLYILALPVTLSHEPLCIVGFVALWNLAGLACLLRALWKLVPPAVALAGTALVASAPGPLLFSRKIWNPDFIPAGVMLFVLLVTLGLERPRRAPVVGLFVVGTILTGFHVTTVLLLASLLAWAWLLRVPLERRGIALGCAAALLLLSPYLWFLVSSGFDDPLALFATHGEHGAGGPGRLGMLLAHARSALETACDGGLLAALPGNTWSAVVATGFRAFTALAALWYLARLPLLVLRARRGAALEPFEKLLALGALFELALLCTFALARVPVVPHYSAVLIPFPALAALGLAWHLVRRLGPAPLVAAGALVVGAHTQLFVDFLAELRLHGPPAGSHYGFPFEPRAPEWRAKVAAEFDEIDSGHARERAREARARARFEASSDVLMHYDPAHDAPPATVQGSLELHPAPDGLEIVGSSALDMLQLPPFDVELRGHAVLRLELWSPKEVAGAICYTTVSSPEYKRRQMLLLDTRPGENVHYFEIPADDAAGRLMIRHGAHRWILRAAEVRRVPL